MMAGATRLYERMDEWQADAPPAPFTPEAFRFIQEIGRRRKNRIHAKARRREGIG